MRKVSILTAIVMALTVMTASVALAGPDGPTCVSTIDFVFGDDVANHGQHIVGDYAHGGGRNALGWPPSSGSNARGGAALPGGPAAGEGGHFDGGAAPGASFCTDSESPGAHPEFDA